MIKSLFNTISSAMGLKESKAISLTYDEAQKRISDAEGRRLSEAFKRVSVGNNIVDKKVFIQDILGDQFPPKIAEYLYIAFGGGNKGIQFKDVVCGLLVLTRGTTAERIKFLFAFYTLESGGCTLVREEWFRFLQVNEGVHITDTLESLFRNGNTVDLETWSKWIVAYPAARRSTTLISLLLGDEGALSIKSFTLSDDHEPPTFYQTLAGVTHLDEDDIIELEKRYWNIHTNSKSGKLDLTTLSELVSPPLPEPIVGAFFDAFDENCDGHIDFKEMACGVSAAARGPLTERQKFCFKIFDQDKDGILSIEELTSMIGVMKSCLVLNLTDPPKDEVLTQIHKDNSELLGEIMCFASHGGLTLEEYLVWSLENILPEQFLGLIYQICQIILGLRPLTPQEEYEVVSAWIGRDDKSGLEPGSIRYLISIEWWTSWLNYASPGPSLLSKSDSGVGSTMDSNSQSNSFASLVSDSGVGGGGSVNGERSGSRGNSRCWSTKKGTIEASLAMDVSHNVVMTGISPIEGEFEGNGGGNNLNSIPNTSSSSLSLVTMDSSRSTCSTPSPMNSPSTLRRYGGSSTNSCPPPRYLRRGRPGAIDNSFLLATLPGSLSKVPSLTSEGGRLRRDLLEGRDFRVVSQPLWFAFHQWYGSQVPLPRQVIQNEKKVELELYPITLLLYKHVLPPAEGPKAGAMMNNMSPWSGMYGAANISATIALVQSQSQSKRTLAFTATFSRKSSLASVFSFLCSHLRLSPLTTRLDLLTPDDLSFIMVLEDDGLCLEELGLKDLSNLLIEVQHKNQVWPEEIGILAGSGHGGDGKGGRGKFSQYATEKGLTGLSNLGNTCFMNSALQCVSNTRPLTLYFTRRMHLYEINKDNKLGMRGAMAKQYGDLINELWSGTTKIIAPIKIRLTFAKNPNFAGFLQNDAQELLSFLLDALHEDLNRVTETGYTELKDSDNRPAVACAQEAWENHLLRNKSVIVDLFQGQLLSTVRCGVCDKESLRFDPFTFLTLPLPMESYSFCDFLLIRMNGAIPVRYGILALMEERLGSVKAKLSALTGSDEEEVEGGGPPKIPARNLVFAEIRKYKILRIFNDEETVKDALASRPIYAYQVDFSSGEQPPSGKQDGEQIKRIMNSAKNNVLLRSNPPPLENGVSNSILSSSSSSSSSDDGLPSITSTKFRSPPFNVQERLLFVVHRKILRQENYFLASQKSRPSLFGLPFVIPYLEGMTHVELYQAVWALVERLLSPLPPSELATSKNHAQDCDDSLGYEYPFMLRVVLRNAENCCGICCWNRFCRGCAIQCSENEIVPPPNSSSVIALDWDPTALHLRYRSSQESEHIEHASVQEALRRQSESIALNSCLSTFTSMEELKEDERYSCSACKLKQPATKKLQIWRLPPILCIQLKRFEFTHGNGIKSHKPVDFPFRDFDPSGFLADVPRRTIEAARRAEGDAKEPREEDRDIYPLQDFHQHRLQPGYDPLSLKYNLFAIVCHTGSLALGHYLSYAKGANGRWYLFNDSSVREIPEENIDRNSAYLLFYERVGIDEDGYMPRIDPRALPRITEDDEANEEKEFRDLRSICKVF